MDFHTSAIRPLHTVPAYLLRPLFRPLALQGTSISFFGVLSFRLRPTIFRLGDIMYQVMHVCCLFVLIRCEIHVLTLARRQRGLRGWDKVTCILLMAGVKANEVESGC
jgi:hypothetical protein